VPNADRQAPIVSEYLQQIKEYNVAILNDQTPYANEIRNALQRAWPEVDAQIKFQDGYSASQSDYSPVIEKLKESDVKVVYVMGTPSGVANLVRQARAQGLQSLFIASEAGASPLLWSTAGESANGMLVNFFPDPSRNDQTTPIVSRMRENGRQPSVYGLYAYAAVQTLSKAMDGTYASSA
jgi:branched-chain amino acid transport system substrate-binding protein